MNRVVRLWQQQSLAIVAVVFAVVAGWLIHDSSNRQTDALYRSAVEQCQRGNETRVELDQLYSAFETHNTLTFQLFAVVGETIRADDPKVAQAFTSYSKQYAHIQHEYDNVEPVKCQRVIEKP